MTNELQGIELWRTKNGTKVEPGQRLIWNSDEILAGDPELRSFSVSVASLLVR